MQASVFCLLFYSSLIVRRAVKASLNAAELSSVFRHSGFKEHFQ